MSAQILMNSLKLYCHIGLAKTGTSAIQLFLATNRRILARKQGILYPNLLTDKMDTGGNQNHIGTFFYFSSGKYQNRSVSECIEDFQRCKEFCQARGYQAILISAELGGNPSFRDAVFEITKELDFDTYIICYLRRQDAWIEAIWKQQVLKLKEFNTIDDYVDAILNGNMPIHSKNLYYFDLISSWARLFGKERIIVKLYEKKQLSKGLIHDFLTEIKVPFDSTLKNVGNVNPGLSNELMAFYQLCKPTITGLHDNRLYDYLLRSFRTTSQKAPFGKYNLISPVLRCKILEYFDEQNQNVAREYLGRKDGRLFIEPWPDPDEKWEPYELTLEKVAPTIMQLIFKLHQQQEYHKSRIDQLQKQLTKQSGHPREIKQDAVVSAAELERLHQEVKVLKQQLDLPLSSGKELQRELTHVRQELIKANQQQAIAQNQLHAIQNSLTWRISRAAISKAEKGRMFSKVLQLLRRKMNSISMPK